MCFGYLILLLFPFSIWEKVSPTECKLHMNREFVSLSLYPQSIVGYLELYYLVFTEYFLNEWMIGTPPPGYMGCTDANSEALW